MRRLVPCALLLVAFLCLNASCTRRSPLKSDDPAPSPAPQRTQYTIAATLRAEEKTLSVESEILYACPIDELAAVKLRLYANAYAEGNVVVTEDKVAATYPGGKISTGGAEILEATADGQSAPYDLGQGGTLMTLRLPRKYKRGETIRLTVTERVTLANCRHRLGYADGYYFLSDFYPVLCPFREGKYLSYDYTPYGDPFLQETADFALDLTLPLGCECAASSPAERREKQGSAERLSYTLKGARDFAVVCSEKLRYTEDSSAGFPVRYYYENDPKKADTLARVVKAVTEYASLFGEYPYHAYTVVAAPFFEAGVEHSGLSVLSSALSVAERGEVILHETAHQWWFGKVGSDGYRDAWMDEGLAEYAVALSYHRAGSTAAYRAKLRAAEDAFSVRYAIKGAEGARFDRTLTEMADGYYDRVYCGGLLLFAALALKVGEDAMISALRTYATEYAGAVATPEDLIRSLSDSLGEDLSPFFTARLSCALPID